MRPAAMPRRAAGASGVSAPADRRFRRPDMRPERRRLLRMTWRLTRYGAPALALIAIAGWAVSVAMQSDWLRVQHIVVRGNVRLSTAEVEGLMADLRRENILRVPLDRYQHRLLESPWIERATLARVLPGTIHVAIVERTPLAIARVGRQLLLVDAAGVIIDDYTAEYASFDLPVVDGLVPSRDGAVDPERIRLAGRLLEALAARPDLGSRVSQIDASNPRDAVVMLDEDTVWLHLGGERFVERLATYLDLTPTLDERFETIDAVDLRFDERVFVRGREQGPAQGSRF